MMFILGSLESA